ncbi:hypothetical protein SteCoe_16217 [Stentor coeruleus]|uniref:Uncharacterized protein n=1 Tax=Stentor coeruleus TaxID=5963 RepID=A0A1R2C1N3_9CILI|nr:hypothetical protein SteCoe_16217 [Stentor coeruleus]
MIEHSLKDDVKAFEDIKTYTRKFTKPRHTRAEKTLGHFSCPCSVCNTKFQKPPSYNISIENKEHLANTQGKEKSFTWLLRELGKASQTMSIKVNIPETVVFHKSKANFLLYQHSDRTLKMTSTSQSLKLSELRKFLTQASKHHKREENPEGHHHSSQNYGKEVVLVRYLGKSQDNELAFLSPANENGALRVMQEIEFSELMHERPGSSVWKRISYIQTVVKCKGGIGETHIMKYYKHDENDKKGIFDIQQAGQDDSEGFELGFIDDIQKYSEFICKRIAYVLLANAKKDLLRMNAEFIVDDNGKMWLTYATRISVKDIREENYEKVLFKRVQLRSSETKERLDKEICWTEGDTTGPNQLRMLSVMKKHYIDLKKRIGIEDLIREKPKDSLSNLAFSQLHPYAQYTLNDLIDPESSNKQFKDIKPRRSSKPLNPRRSHSRINIENPTKSLSKSKIHTSSCRAVSQHKQRSFENLKTCLTTSKTSAYAIYYI